MSAAPLFWHLENLVLCVFLCAVPCADELRRLMMLHGGQFHLYYTHSKTTHIIATNLPNSKIQELRGEKVVRPEWITDRCVTSVHFARCRNTMLYKYWHFCVLCSIKAGRQLSYIQYQLYTKQKGLTFAGVCAQGGQDLSFSHRPPKPSPSHTQSDSIKPSHTQTLSKEVLKSTQANHTANFTDQTNHQLDVRLWVYFIPRMNIEF